jgi:hypothetical protein
MAPSRLIADEKGRGEDEPRGLVHEEGMNGLR